MDKWSLSLCNSPISSSFFYLYWNFSEAFYLLAVSTPPYTPILPDLKLCGVYRQDFLPKPWKFYLFRSPVSSVLLNLLADFNFCCVECIRKEHSSLEILSSLGSSTNSSLCFFLLLLSHWHFLWSLLEPPFSAGYLNVLVPQVSALAPFSLCIPSPVAHSIPWCKYNKHASHTPPTLIVPEAQVHKSIALW